MELRQLRAFQAVARERHFGRAADCLQVAPSSVTVQVQRLEQELDVELFNRTTRRTTLTEAGQLLLPHANEILASADRAASGVNAFVRRQQRTVVLGAEPDLGERADRIREAYSRLEPDGELRVVACTGRDKLRRVRDGQLDAAVLRTGEPAGSLELVPVWSDPLVAAVATRGGLSGRGAIALGDLADIPLRLAARQDRRFVSGLVLAACAEAGFSPTLGPPFETDREALDALATGDSVPFWAVYTATEATRLKPPGVSFRRLRDPAPVATTFLALGRRRDAPGVVSLIQACREG